MAMDLPALRTIRTDIRINTRPPGTPLRTIHPITMTTTGGHMAHLPIAMIAVEARTRSSHETHRTPLPDMVITEVVGLLTIPLVGMVKPVMVVIAVETQQVEGTADMVCTAAGVDLGALTAVIRVSTNRVRATALPQGGGGEDGGCKTDTHFLHPKQVVIYICSVISSQDSQGDRPYHKVHISFKEPVHKQIYHLCGAPPTVLERLERPEKPARPPCITSGDASGTELIHKAYPLERLRSSFLMLFPRCLLLLSALCAALMRLLSVISGVMPISP